MEPGAPPGTFQAILQLNTGSAAGDIAFQYVAMGSSTDSGGNFSTTGIKDLGSPTERRLVVQYNEPGNPFVAPGQAIRIRRASEPALVVARHVFYNNSAFDSRRAAADAGDDSAIDATVVAGLPGGPLGRDHFTSYSRGINGLMLDIAGLPGGAGPGADDFEFRLLNLPTVDPWTPVALTPQVAIRRGAGADGSDRLTLVLPDAAVRNTWLEVKLLANERTGLSTPELCYFGNLVGDVVPTPDPGGSSFHSRVEALDLREVRAARGQPAAPVAIASRADINRDGRVNLFDEALVRANLLRSLYHRLAPLPDAIAGSTGRLSARRRPADYLLG